MRQISVRHARLNWESVPHSPQTCENGMYNILFVCSGNSARSIMCEAYLNSVEGDFRAYSAGSHPKRIVHPLTLEILCGDGIGTENLRSKSWDEFAGGSAPPMDFIITVCDSAAGEVCPLWPGQPVTAHWSFPDPPRSRETRRRRGNISPMSTLRSAAVWTYCALCRWRGWITLLLDRSSTMSLLAETGTRSKSERRQRSVAAAAFGWIF